MSWTNAQFPYIAHIRTTNHNGDDGFIDALKTNFADRFDHFSIEVRKFVKDPFCVNVEGEFASEAKELVVSDEAT